MKSFCCCLFLLVASEAFAFVPAPRFREIPIAVVPGSEQRHPVVSENWIAWQDDRATPIVHGVRAEDRAT
ncbi:MAG TPA: hypothetical protein VF175_00025, partial [Lacipirellula sp.]